MGSGQLRELVNRVVRGLLVALCCFLLGDAQAQQAYYHYFKEKRPLVERNEVAVFDAQGKGTLEVQRSLEADGFIRPAVRALPIRGWSIASLDESSMPVAVRDHVTSAAMRGDHDFVSPVFRATEEGTSDDFIHVTPVLLIRFEDGVSSGVAEAILQRYQVGNVIERDWAGAPRAYRINTNRRNGYDVLDIANRLAVLPQVRYAEPDMAFTGRGDLYPNDPGFSDCWGLHNTGQAGGTPDEDMDVPEAWETTTGSESLKVLVIDCGVQQDHPDINQLPGVDLTYQGPTSMGGPVNYCDNHGTMVAGCVSATMNNTLGIVGIAPDCKVISARTFISVMPCTGSWSTYSSWTVDALAWGLAQGARVSNNSNCYAASSSSITDKYNETYAAGMVHFASAGNSSEGTVAYPASLLVVNCVAATDRSGVRASFSNYGEGVDFSAPGVDIYTTDRTGADGNGSGDHTWIWGTSFATPYAAGVAALVLAVRPEATPAQVEEFMRDSCVDKGTPGYDTEYGWGVVNANGAVAAALVTSTAGWSLYE